MNNARWAAFASRICLVIGMAAFCTAADIPFATPTRGLDFTKGDTPKPGQEPLSLRLGAITGVPNGFKPRGGDGNQILIVSYADGTYSRGVLQKGDVILGVNGRMFESDVIDTWRDAVAVAFHAGANGNLRVIRWRKGTVATVDFRTGFGPPDLTFGTNRFAVNRTSTYNLGPTGLRGWFYRSGAGERGLQTDPDRQILVTDVGTGTPATAILQVADVILGVQAGRSGTVPLFSNDCRKAFGWTIGDAEAGDGTFSLMINRYGVGTDQYYTIHLGLTGLAYSATAPYNCPKSSRILADAINIISNMAFSLGVEVANPVLGLAKMAVGITNEAMRSYAHAIAPAPGSLSPYWDKSIQTWQMGYQNLFLEEYFLYTGDTGVTNGIRELAVTQAHAQDMRGMYGHYGCEDHHDGTFNHTSLFYGPMNAATLPNSISLVLSKKCGISHPDIDAAIARGNTWFSYFVGKGSLPYGEHETWWPGSHCSNGKDSMAAMLFALQGDHPAEAKYYERMSVATIGGREYGHVGQGYSYLWTELGAHQGGMTSLYTHVAPIRWHLDLSRRCNGSFAYDGAEQYGGSVQPSYWGSATYADGAEPTTYYVLLYSLPLRKLLITGRGLNPANQLSLAEISNTMWAADYGFNCSGYRTNELLSHFGEYDPGVRSWAAQTLATMPGSNTLVSTLIAMTTTSNSLVRATACQALGATKMTNGLPALMDRMYDTDTWVRTVANRILRDYGTAVAGNQYLTNMMAAFIAHGSLDPYALDPGDPVRIANGYLAEVLFNTLASTIITNQNTNLLCQAASIGLAQPTGGWRGQMRPFLNILSVTNVQMLAPSLVQCAGGIAPFDRMFAHEVCQDALTVLAKYRIEEGIPLCVKSLETRWTDWLGHNCNFGFNNLSNYYRGAAWEALPTFKTWQAYWPTWQSQGAPAAMSNWIWYMITCVTNDPAPPMLTYFKKFTGVSATPAAISMPASNVVLNCAATDASAGVLAYTWSTTQGVGTVTFSQNSTPGATNVTASFSAPGVYVITVACVDKSLLDISADGVTSTWKWSSCSPWGEPSLWHDFQTYTNILGAVYTNVTVTVYGTNEQEYDRDNGSNYD